MRLTSLLVTAAVGAAWIVSVGAQSDLRKAAPAPSAAAARHRQDLLPTYHNDPREDPGVSTNDSPGVSQHADVFEGVRKVRDDSR
jgi:hypothetical protein